MHKIGLLKELKQYEGRVLLTPEGVKVLVKNGIQVFVESEAGKKSNFDDVLYEKNGATILPTMEKVLQKASLILQVQPPSPIQYELFNEHHTVLSFQNMQQTTDRIKALLESNAVFFSIEMVQDEESNYPVLMGMSEIAGRMTIHKAAQLLTITEGGKGKLLSGADIVKPATVTVIGGGKAGRTAAITAKKIGAHVRLLTLKESKLQEVKTELGGIEVEMYSEQRLSDILPDTDVLIVAVYSLRREFDLFIRKELINLMEPGSVVIDISIEQKDIVETSHLTSHDKPTYILDGIVHYCVPNIAAVVPLTASKILTKKLLPYVKTLALNGLKNALDEEPGLIPALTIYKGKMTNRYLAEHFGHDFYNIFELLELNL